MIRSFIQTVSILIFNYISLQRILESRLKKLLYKEVVFAAALDLDLRADKVVM